MGKKAWLNVAQAASVWSCNSLPALPFDRPTLCSADDVITPEDVFDVMEEDVQKADLILWVGISFEQSASTAYFRRVCLCELALVGPVMTWAAVSHVDIF